MTKSSILTNILTINGGSSSIKFALYQDGEPLERGLYGKIDRIGFSGTNLTFDETATNRHDSFGLPASDHKSAATFLMDWLQGQNRFGLWGTVLSMACSTRRRNWSLRNYWTIVRTFYFCCDPCRAEVSIHSRRC